MDAEQPTRTHLILPHAPHAHPRLNPRRGARAGGGVRSVCRRAASVAHDFILPRAISADTRKFALE
jgi:hypothetical protein